MANRGDAGPVYAQLGITEGGDYLLTVYLASPASSTPELCGRWTYNFGPYKPDCMAWSQLELTREVPCDDDFSEDADCDFTYATCKVTSQSAACPSYECDEAATTACVPVGIGCCCDSAASWAVDLGDGGWAAGDACLGGCEDVQGIYIVDCCGGDGGCEDVGFTDYYDCYESTFWAEDCAFGTDNQLRLRIIVHNGVAGNGIGGTFIGGPAAVSEIMHEEYCCAIYVEIMLDIGVFIGETWITLGYYSYACYRAINIEPDGSDLCVGPYTLTKIYEEHVGLNDPGHFCDGSTVCIGYLPDTITVQGA